MLVFVFWFRSFAIRAMRAVLLDLRVKQAMSRHFLTDFLVVQKKGGSNHFPKDYGLD